MIRNRQLAKTGAGAWLRARARWPLRRVARQMCIRDRRDAEPSKERSSLPGRGTREVQAESVAYVVSSWLGLDTSDYSFGYIASWSDGRDVSELRASLDEIRSASHGIIDVIEREASKTRVPGERERAKETERTPGRSARSLAERAGAVSYTHLDVYKRQARHTQRPSSSGHPWTATPSGTTRPAGTAMPDTIAPSPTRAPRSTVAFSM